VANEQDDATRDGKISAASARDVRSNRFDTHPDLNPDARRDDFPI
jgi:hypothetical protein